MRKRTWVREACIKCGGTSGMVRGEMCRSCRAAYMREWRKKNGVTFLYDDKAKARKQTKYAISTGVLVPQPCQMCGAVSADGQQIQAHHFDYSKPLEVHWLCRDHHVQLHSALRRRKVTVNPDLIVLRVTMHEVAA